MTHHDWKTTTYRRPTEGGYPRAKRRLGLPASYFNRDRGTAIPKPKRQMSNDSNQPDMTLSRMITDQGVSE